MLLDADACRVSSGSEALGSRKGGMSVVRSLEQTFPYSSFELGWAQTFCAETPTPELVDRLESLRT